MRIDAYITEYAQKTPQNIALEEGNNAITYGSLDSDISIIASSLMDFKHCRFAILAESGILYVKLLMAVYRSSNIAIPLPIEFPMFSLELILDAANVRNIITTDTQYSRFGESFFERFKTVIVVSKDSVIVPKESLLKTLRKNIESEFNNPELRLVMYTSGTTGTP
jgi:long-chain acyl-CoA synthetase